MALISIIIPVYNTELYLRKCLDSVLAQTFTDFEVICVNDGSIDNSQGVLEEYLKKDSRFRLVKQDNRGVSAARNAGLKLVTGDYIAFLDSDDYWHSDFLTILYEGMQTTKSDVVGCAFLSVNTHTDQDSLRYEKQVKWRIFDNPLKVLLDEKILISFTVWNKLYRKDMILNKFHFIDGIYFEDWVFIVCVFSEIHSFAFLDQPFYFYYASDHSIMRSRLTIQKIDSYQKGIESTFRFFSHKKDSFLLSLIKKTSIAKSIQMMLDQEYKDWSIFKDAQLKAYLKTVVLDLNKKKLIDFFALTWRHKIRLIDLIYSFNIYGFLKQFKRGGNSRLLK